MDRADREFFCFDNVRRRFIRREGLFAEPFVVDAVRGVSLRLERGRTMGLVGESGCGKSTLARMAVGLLEPDSGEILMGGRALAPRGGKGRLFHPERIQMVFQDPYSSFNPRLSVGGSVGEALICQGLAAAEVKKRVGEMLRLVGLDAAHAGRYPHEFSGGQRQRLAIARALITRPELIVCDEPVSSLDASVQAQVLGLLKEMQETFDLAYLFISHDLAVVSHMSDTTAVMHQGLIVEQADSKDIFEQPLHPYTRALLSAVPDGPGSLDQNMPLARATAAAPREEPPPSGEETGDSRCLYAPACPSAMACCYRCRPLLAPAGRPGHLVRCFLYSSSGNAASPLDHALR